MREFPFDDIADGKMTIKIDDRETNTYIQKTIDPTCWKDALREFVNMLNGCGYIINPIKAEDVFNELQDSQRKEYLNDE